MRYARVRAILDGQVIVNPATEAAIVVEDHGDHTLSVLATRFN